MHRSVWLACLSALVVALAVHSNVAAAGLASAADWAATAAAVVSPAALALPQTAADFLQQRAPAQRQLPQSSKPLVVAHRGASGPLPEHTAPAYLEAIREGADFIECDLVVTKDLQLICRHEPNLNDTTDAWQLFGDRATSYLIDGEHVQGVFAADLTLAEVRQLRARQRWAFRDHSHDGLFGLVTFEEFIDLALAAGRPVGIYPEAKHPTWHNQLPAMRAGHTTLEELMVQVLHSKGYATSAPYGSTAWHSQPIFIQSFEVTSLRRFAAMTPVPLALLLDRSTAPDTGSPSSDLLTDESLAELSSFVTVMAPWKAMLYTLVGRRRPGPRPGPAGLVLPSGGAADSANGAVLANASDGTDSSRRLLGADVQGSAADVSEDDADSSSSSTAAGFEHPDVPLSSTASSDLQATQQLRSTGLAARLHRHGFLVHTFTVRDEGQFVLPTCKQGIACEFEFLFGSEHLDGAFADWPGTMYQWIHKQHGQPAIAVGH